MKNLHDNSINASQNTLASTGYNSTRAQSKNLNTQNRAAPTTTQNLNAKDSQATSQTTLQKLYENPPNDSIDERQMYQKLDRLIHGMHCDEIAPYAAQKGLVIQDKQILDASKVDKTSLLSFEGRTMRGGVFENGVYMSDDREFVYELDLATGGSTLHIHSVCKRTSFEIRNFAPEKEDFGIRLCPKGYREIAFVYCNNRAMQPYIKGMQEIAKGLARRIFGDRAAFAKALLCDYMSATQNVRGVFYNEEELIAGLASISPNLQEITLLNAAMIESMSYFTKHNGLAKELYLIASAPPPSDRFRYEDMAAKMKNLNANIAQGLKENAINQVVFQGFAIGEELGYMRELCEQSGGKYWRVDSVLELKRALLTQCGNGVPPNPSELGRDTEILIHKNHKLEPDNPPCG